MSRKSFITLILIFLFMSNMSLSYAFWASQISDSSEQNAIQLSIGSWTQTFFVGVTQDGLGDLITLDEIGTGPYGLDGNYVLMSDIDWNNNPFIPIGGVNGDFTGTFNGNGYKISNLNITADQANVGLFSRNSGTITEVSLINVNINVSSVNDINAGGLVGENTGIISKSYTTGSLSITVTKSAGTNGLTSNAFGGGLVGINSGTITNSHSSLIVNVATNTNISSGGNRAGFANSYAGGLIGRNTSNSVNYSHADGNVSASSTATANGNSLGHATSVAGGLVGQTTTSNGINNSFAAGNVTTTTAGKTSNTNNAGPVSGLGLVATSYRRNGQLINNVSNGGTINGAILATQAELRTESFLVTNLSWISSEWIFDTSFYPRIVDNSY